MTTNVKTMDVAKVSGTALLETVLVAGDLKDLTPAQRLDYYSRVCESMGLNPLSRPFDYIVLNSRLTLYAKKDATDQLRSRREVSITRLERERIDDVYTVTAYAQMPSGRQDSSIGAVSIGGLKGDSLANAFMKAETKAKRRVTLSICGLGWLDETELETIRDARPAHVDAVTGEIIDPSAAAPAQAHGEDQQRPSGQELVLQCGYEGCKAQIDPEGVYAGPKGDIPGSLIIRESTKRTEDHSARCLVHMPPKSP